MRDGWLRPAGIFNGETIVAQALRLADGVVAEIGQGPADAPRLAGVVTPGFVDLQVNGGGGVLLNDAPSPARIAAIAKAHRRFGTVALLPTLITDAPEVLDATAAAFLALAESGLAENGLGDVIGLHIEGPHIAVARRGTHDPRFIRPLDARTIDVIAKLRAKGIAVMITLAPEAVSQGQIARLRGMGAVVSLGHSDTTSDHVKQALGEGANCFTHLFNAMSPLLHRQPGMVGAALNSHVMAGIICDGIHVADELVGLAIRARPAPDLTFLVSDAMPTVGGPDHFRLYDMDLHVADGRLVNTQGSLAGAHVTMAASLARLVTHVGIPPDAALRMAVTLPARLMERPDLAQVAGRKAQDLLLLDEQWQAVETLAGDAVARLL